jgi:tellurite methyltransferase
MTGGYDDGYKACPCFWGTSPGSIVVALESRIETFVGLHVLDVGCGEGKNAAYLASKGAIVSAIDVSEFAIANARVAWGNRDGVSFAVQDCAELLLPSESFDIVIAYGLLHCLATEDAVKTTVNRLQAATVTGGFHVICTFNARFQELEAHPEFHPILLPHSFYIDLYKEWEILNATDADLTEVHPHNRISHTHSLTRILARKC